MERETNGNRAERADQARITPAMEDYLKAIFRIEHDGETVSNQRLAEELGFSGASISNMVKKLHDLNLIVHTPYRSITLTEAGNAVALEVIRHHRLLELFLASALGMEIDQVHEEADRLEHHVSEELERRIEQVLGFPEFDPHGHPIPSRAGDLPTIEDRPLTEMNTGESGIVSRVSDRSPEHLRDIQRWNIMPGARISVLSTTDDDIIVSIETGPNVAVPRSIGEGIHILLPVRDATS